MSSEWLHKPLANLIMLIPMVCWFAFCLDIIAPALPFITDDFHVSASSLQNSMSVFFLVCGLTQLCIRSLIIKLGRRTLTLLCYIIIFLGCLIASVSHNLTTLIVARCIQAAGSSATLMISFISVRDITTNAKLRTTLCSYLSTAIAVSPIIIPMIGALIIQKRHWHFTFTYMMALIAIHGLLTFKLFPKAQSNEQHHHESKVSWLSLLVQHTNLAYLIFSGILGASTNFLFLSHSPYIYIVNFGSSPLWYGYCFSLVGFTYMVGCFILPQISKKTGVLKAILFGHGLILIAMMSIFICHIFHMLNALIFTFLTCVTHLGSGILLTGSITGLMNQPKLATDQVIGVYGCLKFVLPALLGWLTMAYGASLFAMSATIIILSTLALLTIIPMMDLSRGRLLDAY